METLKEVVSILLTPIAGVSSYIGTAATAYKKEKQVAYFSAVQSTMVADDQQSDSKIKERAKAISELWTND